MSIGIAVRTGRVVTRLFVKRKGAVPFLVPPASPLKMFFHQRRSRSCAGGNNPGFAALDSSHITNDGGLHATR